MKRDLYADLLAWKNSPYRKPLVLKGARQVGKTYLLNEFGKNEYENLIVLNCDKDIRIRDIFQNGYQPDRIIKDIEVLYNVKVNPKNTLIFIDEVGEVPEALASLKYFCEDAPEYHIIAAGMPVSKLVYERKSNEANENWNYAFGGEPYDYYETLLPHTLMKIWQPLYSRPNNGDEIFINQYHPLNTLTDDIGTFGKDFPYGMHDMENGGFDGVRIDQAASNINTTNGYIHRICSPLVYDRNVNEKVLNERLRIDVSTLVYEMINNDIRFAKDAEIAARNQNARVGTMALIPANYCDHIKVYSNKTKLAFYLQGPWRAWESDQISFWDECDFAFRLPPVPSGTYEVRIIYPATEFGGYMQYYIGNSSSTSSMKPLGIPIDASYPDVTNEAERNDVGYYLSKDVTDYGVASDLIMRNKGFMRAPASFSRGTWNGQKTPSQNADELVANLQYCCRYSNDGGTLFRKILGTVVINQGEERWIRIKNMLTGYDSLGGSVDFIELVPVNIVNSQDYTEDWF